MVYVDKTFLCPDDKKSEIGVGKEKVACRV